MDWKKAITKNLNNNNDVKPVRKKKKKLDILSLKHQNDGILEEKIEENENENENTLEENTLEENDEQDKIPIYNPDLDFDLNNCSDVSNTIKQFKYYIDSLDDPLFDNDKDYYADLYNFIKKNCGNYSILHQIEDNESSDDSSEYEDDIYDY